MSFFRLKRGSIVHDKSDPRHRGIVESIVHRDGKSVANVRWLETSWKSTVPTVDLLLSKFVDDVKPTEVELMKARLGGGK